MDLALPKRGFFCNDQTLQYPYRACTITVPLLALLMLILPMIIISSLEIIRNSSQFVLRKYLRKSCSSLAAFSFGFLATYLSTELAKNTVGRLRPHFFDVCQPLLNDGTSCADAKNMNIYIEQYYCSNKAVSNRCIAELYVSFPSAHSSLSFYSMVYLCFYLHNFWLRYSSHGRWLKYTLQFLLLQAAWYIALSRVRDYWHYWSDVLAGVCMGVIYAVLTAVYIGQLLQRAERKVLPPERRAHERSSAENECEWKLQTPVLN